MSAEVLSVAAITESPKETLPKPKTEHVFYMAGATDTHEKLHGVQQKLAEKFGEKNVTIYGSILFGEKFRKKRFELIGEKLKTAIKEGPTTVLTHSLGTAELLAAFEKIRKDDHDFFNKEKTKENLSVISISPATPKGPLTGIKYALKFVALGVQELGILKHTLPGETSILQGVNSLSLLPPQDEIINHKELIKKTRLTSKKFSRDNGNINEIYFKPNNRYYEDVPDETVNRIKEQDQILKNTTDKEFKKALKRRGIVAKKTVNTILERTHPATYKPKPGTETNKEFPESPEQTIKKLKFLGGTFLKGSAYTRFKKGEFNTIVVTPQYDIAMNINKAKELVGEQNVKTVPLTTHTSPWTLHPEVLINIIDFTTTHSETS